MIKKIIVTQSNYVPWKGFFDGLAQADEIVIYDDMQFTKRDWRNRNVIKTPQGNKWITIPVQVKGKYNQRVNETIISDRGWRKSHLGLLRQNYADSANFKDMYAWIESVYDECSMDTLTEINTILLRQICIRLDINIQFIDSRQCELYGEKSEKLANVAQQRNATDYYCGPASKNYLDESKFTELGINVHYFDYSGYPEYPQLHGNFNHEVSILDLLFNVGDNANKFMKYCFR